MNKSSIRNTSIVNSIGINKSNIKNVSFVNPIGINKRGQTGFSIMSMYRVFIVIFIAVVILGVSSVVYSHHINVRDSEAMIMIREISECVISGSVIDVDSLEGEYNIFEYCGFDEDEVNNFFISVLVIRENKEVLKVEGGDGDSSWVKDIYRSGANTATINKYEPGNFKWTYDTMVSVSGVEKLGSVTVEVVSNV